MSKNKMNTNYLKIKRLIILDSIFVYLIAAMICLTFSQNAFTLWLFENLFDNNVYVPLAFVLVYEFVVFVMTLIYTIRILKSNDYYSEGEALDLAKTQMIMRLVQIPAYAVIFFVGVIGTMLIFMILLSIALYILDVISIAVTGLSSVPVYYILEDAGLISKKRRIIYTICGFLFGMDVIVACLCYIQSKSAA